LQNRPNLHFDPPSGQPKPDMDGSITGMRTVAQIVDGRLVRPEVTGVALSRARLICSPQE
jgi:hypothetical protein